MKNIRIHLTKEQLKRNYTLNDIFLDLNKKPKNTIHVDYSTACKSQERIPYSVPIK